MKTEGEQRHQAPDEGVGVARGGERLDLVPEGVEPHPGLAGVVAGLVHHSPLVAAQVLGAGLVLQVGAVGEQQQRLGLVAGVEGVDVVSRPSRPPVRGEGEESAGEHRHRAVVAGRDLGRVAVRGGGERVGVGAWPMSSAGRRPAAVHVGRAAVSAASPRDGRQRGDDEVVGAVDRDPDAAPASAAAAARASGRRPALL